LASVTFADNKKYKFRVGIENFKEKKRFQGEWDCSYALDGYFHSSSLGISLREVPATIGSA
jgi:hypothetical protein